MSWEALGGIVDPGQSAHWTYGWGSYHGIDIVPAPRFNPCSQLIVSNAGQKLELDRGDSYFVTETNAGSLPVHDHLTGSELTSTMQLWERERVEDVREAGR